MVGPDENRFMPDMKGGLRPEQRIVGSKSRLLYSEIASGNADAKQMYRRVTKIWLEK
jgi:hypothetical protein